MKPTWATKNGSLNQYYNPDGALKEIQKGNGTANVHRASAIGHKSLNKHYDSPPFNAKEIQNSNVMGRGYQTGDINDGPLGRNYKSPPTGKGTNALGNSNPTPEISAPLDVKSTVPFISDTPSETSSNPVGNGNNGGYDRQPIDPTANNPTIVKRDRSAHMSLGDTNSKKPVLFDQNPISAHSHRAKQGAPTNTYGDPTNSIRRKQVQSPKASNPGNQYTAQPPLIRWAPRRTPVGVGNRNEKPQRQALHPDIDYRNGMNGESQEAKEHWQMDDDSKVVPIILQIKPQIQPIQRHCEAGIGPSGRNRRPPARPPLQVGNCQIPMSVYEEPGNYVGKDPVPKSAVTAGNGKKARRTRRND